ncbi:enoyl-CoA hydratase-related protein [Chloroflexota bacterium]
MAYQYAQYEKKDRIAYVTINRPEVMNSLHIYAHRELSEIWLDFRDDSEVWVAILTGAGEKAFCAGNDLKYTAQHSGEPAPLYPPGGFGGITNNFDCPKPIIAAVNGFALGGGLEIAMACDIVIAAEHTRLGLPEPTVGLFASAGGVHRLPRQVPLKVAMGMILTGRQITAEEAYRIGLVNEVVPLPELMETAEKWAQDILRCAPLSVRTSKEAAMSGLGLPLSVAMNITCPEERRMMASEDYKEGPKAFAEKRPPQWKGQ